MRTVQYHPSAYSLEIHKTTMKLAKVFVCIFLCHFSGSEGAKIFFMIPLTTVSEKNVYIPLIDELSKRGHDVIVATIKKSSYESTKIKEFVPLANIDDFLGDYYSPLDGREGGGIRMWLNLPPDHEAMPCEKIYQNPEFNRTIHEQFDLIVINSFFQYCFDAVVYKQKAPFIMVGSSAPRNGIVGLTGNVLPTSFVPNPLIPLSSPMSFWQRMVNLLFDTYWRYFEVNVYSVESAKVAKKYMGEDVPNPTEIEKNVSLILSNSNFVLNWPVPILPDVVEVGGMHCRPTKPLPKDLDDFISGAKDGLIYFSLGSIVKSEKLPEEHIKMFLSVFSKLKQRVLWKLGGKPRGDLPANVKVSSWCPQQDILGHPNTKLFMSHGGLLSTQEAIYHGVPVVGLPIFMDQDTNIIQAEAKGFAKKLELLTLTEEKISSAINEILHNPAYSKKAKEMSRLYRDQPQTPLERAVFWVEYVIRHNGAPHMRSAARDLNYIQYYCLDVLFVLLGAVFVILFVVYSILKKMLSILCGKGKQQKQKRQ